MSEASAQFIASPINTPALRFARVSLVGDVPKPADPMEVDALIAGIVSSFRVNAGSQPITRSVVPRMGPGAKAGEAGWILEASLSTHEDAMTALHAEDFQDSKARTEALGSTIFLFEVQEL